jgi:hypothetical protein
LERPILLAILTSCPNEEVEDDCERDEKDHQNEYFSGELHLESVLQSRRRPRREASGHAIRDLRSGRENHHECGDDHDGHDERRNEYRDEERHAQEGKQRRVGRE